MKRGLAFLGLCLLLSGCGDVSRRELIGSYVLVVDNTAQAFLELKDDGSFVQTLRFKGQPEETRTGKWSFSDQLVPGKSARIPADAYGPYAFLENAAALEGCPKCKAVPAETVVYQVQAGMMNVFLVEDLKSGVGYAK